MMKKKLLYLALFFTLPLGIASAYTIDDAIMYYLKYGKTPPFLDQLPSKDRIVAIQQINQLNTIVLTPTTNKAMEKPQTDEKEKIEEKIAELKEALSSANAREYYITVTYKLDDLHKYIAIPYDELPRELKYSRFSFVGADACITNVNGTKLIIVKNPTETLKAIVNNKGLPSCSEAFTDVPKVETIEIVKDGERVSAQDTFPLDTSKDSVHLKANVKIDLNGVNKLTDSLGFKTKEYLSKVIPITDDVYLKYQVVATVKGSRTYKALVYELYVKDYKVAQNTIAITGDEAKLDLPIDITIYKDKVEGQVGGIEISAPVSLTSITLSQDTKTEREYSYESDNIKDFLIKVYNAKEDDSILDSLIDAFKKAKEIFFNSITGSDESTDDDSKFSYKEEVSIEDYTYNKAVQGNYYTIAKIVSLREASNEEKAVQKKMLKEALQKLELLKKKYEEQ